MLAKQLKTTKQLTAETKYNILKENEKHLKHYY